MCAYVLCKHNSLLIKHSHPPDTSSTSMRLDPGRLAASFAATSFSAGLPVIVIVCASAIACVLCACVSVSECVRACVYMYL